MIEVFFAILFGVTAGATVAIAKLVYDRHQDKALRREYGLTD